MQKNKTFKLHPKFILNTSKAIKLYFIFIFYIYNMQWEGVTKMLDIQ